MPKINMLRLMLVLLSLAMTTVLAASPTKTKAATAPAFSLLCYNLKSIYIDMSFKGFDVYEPSARLKRPSDGTAVSNRYKLLVSSKMQVAYGSKLKDAVEGGLKDAFGKSATLQTLEAGSDGPNIMKAVDKFDYMKKREALQSLRDALLTLEVTYAKIEGASDGKLINPYPLRINAQGEAIPSLGSIFSTASVFSEAEKVMEGVEPLTFDGTSTLSFEMKYSVYETSTFTKLRGGTIKGVTATTSPWSGKWAFPRSGTGEFIKSGHMEKYLTYSSDNRVDIYGVTLQEMLPKIRAAVRENFGDAEKLVDAAKELARGKR